MGSQARRQLNPTYNAFVDLKGVETGAVESMLPSVRGAEFVSTKTTHRVCNGSRTETTTRVWSVTEFGDVVSFLDFGSLVGAGPSYRQRVIGSLMLSKAGDVSLGMPPLTFQFKEKRIGDHHVFTTLRVL